VSNIKELLGSIHKNKNINKKITFETIPLIPFLSPEDPNIFICPLAVFDEKYQTMTMISKALKWQRGDINSVEVIEIPSFDTLKSKRKVDFSFYKYSEFLRDNVQSLVETPELSKNLYEEVFGNGYFEEIIGCFQSELSTSSLNQNENIPPELISEIENFSKDHPEYSLNKMIQELKTTNVAANFRLGIVGEFSRGKSTLINDLLGNELLPYGVTPTTATLTSIKYSPEESLQIRKNEKTEKRNLSKDMWQGLVADGNEKSSIGQAQLLLNNSWLKSCNIEIVDTPGISDTNQERSLKVQDILTNCDGVIVCLSADQPLGLTEVEFIENEILDKKTPRVLAVVNYLDDIKEKERSGVLNHISEKLSKISKNIKIIGKHRTDGTSNIEEIKGLISKMCSVSSRNSARASRGLFQISTKVRKVLHTDEVKLNLLKDPKELEKKKDILKEEFNQSKQSFIQLQEEMRSRKDRLEDFVVKSIQPLRMEFFDDYIERALVDGRDLDQYTEKVLPLDLKRFLKIKTTNSTKELEKNISEDFMWYNASLSKLTNLESVFLNPVYRSKEEDNIEFHSRKKSGNLIDKICDNPKMAVGVGVILPLAGLMSFGVIPAIGGLTVLVAGPLTGLLSKMKKDKDSVKYREAFEIFLKEIFKKIENDSKEKINNNYEFLILEKQNEFNELEFNEFKEILNMSIDKNEVDKLAIKYHKTKTLLTSIEGKIMEFLKV
jgi:small GTP-binding protein